jgi:polysaccharide biosynthesis/export protein ExoF
MCKFVVRERRVRIGIVGMREILDKGLTDKTCTNFGPLWEWSCPMRAIIKNFVMAFSAAAILAGSFAYGQDNRAPQDAADGSRPAPTVSAKVPLEIGDKLRISFYETIDLGVIKQGGRDRAEPEGALRTFYQRMDLSGEYTVEQNGAISIPLLGQFQIEGRALDDVRADVAVSYTAIIGRSANIDVKILERSPIYVVGPVKNPGAYKHVPAMIVLHAIALAGGLDRGEVSGIVEGAREMERLRSTTLHVKQLLARRARLEAERDGASTLPIPVQLATLAGEETARTFMATESAILRADQAKRRQQGREIALRVAAAQGEVEALKGKLDQIEVQKGMRVERLNDLQKLKDRGWGTSNNVVTLRTELSDIEAHRQDYLVSILQAETRLAEAGEAGSRLSSEETANLTNAIATVDKDIAAAQEAMISARMLATILYRPGGSSQSEGYAIVRQSREGAKTLQATETSPLLPGDVLKIIPKALSIIPSSLHSVPQSEPMVPGIQASNRN